MKSEITTLSFGDYTEFGNYIYEIVNIYSQPVRLLLLHDEASKLISELSLYDEISYSDTILNDTIKANSRECCMVIDEAMNTNLYSLNSALDEELFTEPGVLLYSDSIDYDIEKLGVIGGKFKVRIQDKGCSLCEDCCQDCSICPHIQEN